MKRIRYFSMALAVAMLLCILTGCGGGKPKTAKDVMSRAAESMSDSYHMLGEVGMDMSIDASDGSSSGGMSMSMPIKLMFDMDCDGDESRGSIGIKMDFMGDSLDDSFTLYSAPDGIYCDTGSGWELSDNPADLVGFSDSFRTFNPVVFDSAELAYDEASNTYAVRLPLGSMMTEEMMGDWLSDVGGDGSGLGGILDMDEVLEKMSAANAMYVVDAESFLVKSVSCEPVELSYDSEEDGYDMTVGVKLTFDFKFDKHGQVTVERPDVSASPAEPLPEDGDSGFLFDGSDTGDAQVSGDAVYGTLNGHDVELSGNDFTAVFGSDGWVVDSDGEYSFVCFENAKYSDADLYLYPAGGDYSANHDVSDILVNGFAGYHVSAVYCDRKPDMNWNGLTFGASVEDIEAVYGPASDVYECDMYTALTYDFGSGDQYVDLEFYVYAGSEYGDAGLQAVDLSIY